MLHENAPSQLAGGHMPKTHANYVHLTLVKAPKFTRHYFRAYMHQPEPFSRLNDAGLPGTSDLTCRPS